MEPFRPWVDYTVYLMANENSKLKVCKETKIPLLNLLAEPISWEQQTLPLMVACHYLMANLKRAYEDSTVSLYYPQRLKESRKSPFTRDDCKNAGGRATQEQLPRGLG